MKTAIYIEDGLLQVVVTPESDFERSALSAFKGKPVEAQVFFGSFYDCRGGWVRQTAHMAGWDGGDQSLIIRTVEPSVPEPAPSADPAIAKLDEMIAAGEPRSDAE